MGQVKALRRTPSIGGVLIDEVFDRHHADVYRYLARRVPADVAEDLASETFVQAVTRGHTFDPERGVLRGWIFGIASNLRACQMVCVSGVSYLKEIDYGYDQAEEARRARAGA